MQFDRNTEVEQGNYGHNIHRNKGINFFVEIKQCFTLDQLHLDVDQFVKRVQNQNSTYTVSLNT